VIHMWDLQFGRLELFLWKIHVFSNLYIGAHLTLKVAILLEWIRVLFPSQQRKTVYWWAIHGTLAFTVIGYLFMFLIWNLHCQPHEAIYRKTLANKCLDIVTIEIPCVTINLVIDMAILLIPQPVIWKLKMPRSRKIGVSVVFIVGTMSVIAGAVRTYIMTLYVKGADTSWLSGQMYSWSVIEIACGIVTYCAISAPKFYNESAIVKTITSRFRSTVSSSSKASRSAITQEIELSVSARSASEKDLKTGTYFKINDSQYSQEV
jgi:hypothetical protein